jgi:hypothetical protein
LKPFCVKSSGISATILVFFINFLAFSSSK